MRVAADIWRSVADRRSTAGRAEPELGLASLGENRFSTISIPAIGATVLLDFVEMMIDLGVQGSEHADGCTFDTRLSS